MGLVHVLSLVLTQFSVGSLLMVSLLPTREIRVGFFTLNSLLCALTAAIALVLLRFGGGEEWMGVRYLGLTVIGATAAYGCFRLDRMALGRALLIGAGLVGLLFGLLPMVDKALAVRGWHARAPWLFDATVVSGAFLLGVANVGMILGHWYLLMRRLSFEYLERFAKLLLGAAALRILVVLLILFSLKSLDPKLAGMFLPPLGAVDGHLFFFLARIITGLVAPLVLGFLVFRCVEVKANQAATGLLYVVEVSVLFGELFAAVLLI